MATGRELTEKTWVAGSYDMEVESAAVVTNLRIAGTDPQ